MGSIIDFYPISIAVRRFFCNRLRLCGTTSGTSVYFLARFLAGSGLGHGTTVPSMIDRFLIITPGTNMAVGSIADVIPGTVCMIGAIGGNLARTGANLAGDPFLYRLVATALTVARAAYITVINTAGSTGSAIVVYVGRGYMNIVPASAREAHLARTGATHITVTAAMATGAIFLYIGGCVSGSVTILTVYLIGARRSKAVQGHTRQQHQRKNDAK